MSNTLLDARQQIVNALAPLLTGRVQAYKPTVVSAPAIWIDSVAVGVSNDVTVATFTVLGVVDGADHAQLAVLDDMVARSWDAVRAASRPKGRTARTRDVLVDGRTYRGFELNVDVAVQAITLCKPTVEPITIPATEFAEVS